MLVFWYLLFVGGVNFVVMSSCECHLMMFDTCPLC
jgi:hypothetical protein